MRLIINFILIIIIVFSLTIIPINTNLLDININNKDNVENIPEKEEIIEDTFKINLPRNEFNAINNEFKISVTTNNQEKLETLIENFNFDITLNNGSIKTFLLNDIKSSAKKFNSNKDNEFGIEYTFYLQDLNIKSGSYSGKINVNNNYFNKSSNINFLYLKNNTYIGSSNKPPENKLYTKNYVLDENILRLIPINKAIDDNGKFIRTTMNSLLEVPDKKYGLSDTIPAPKIANIYTPVGTARLDFISSAVKPFNEGSASANFAIQSIVKTIGKFSRVKKVKFFVDGVDNSSFFHGTDLSEPFEISNLPKAYVGLETTKKTMLLYPIEITEESLGKKINSIFETLKYVSYGDIPTNSLIPTVPKSVKLLNYKFNKRTLELDLSKEFLTIYKGKSNYNSLMYESLLYSFTSIEGIDSISILIEGKSINTFNNIEISKPQKPNTYINSLN